MTFHLKLRIPFGHLVILVTLVLKHQEISFEFLLVMTFFLVIWCFGVFCKNNLEEKKQSGSIIVFVFVRLGKSRDSYNKLTQMTWNKIFAKLMSDQKH